MAEPEQVQFNENDAAAALYPIFEDPDLLHDPVRTEAAFKNAYAQGEGKWDDSAKALFAKQYDQVKKAQDVKLSTEWLNNIEPPTSNPNKSEDDQVGEIDTWKQQTIDNLSKEGGADWELNKLGVTDVLDQIAQEKKRHVVGSDTGRVIDTVDRIAQAGGMYITNLIGADETGKAIDDFFEENPKFDDTMVAKVAQSVGDIGGSQGIPIAGGGLAGAAAVTFGAVPATAAAITTATFIGLNSLFNAVTGYKAAYDQTFEETGSTNLAAEAGIENGIATFGVQAIVDKFLVAKALPAWVKGLSETGKRKALVGALSGAITQGEIGLAAGALQSIGTQESVGQFTGQPVDWAQVGEEAALSAVGGSVVGAATGAVSGSRRAKTEQPAIEGEVLPPEGPGRPAGPALPGGVPLLTGPDWVKRDPGDIHHRPEFTVRDNVIDVTPEEPSQPSRTEPPQRALPAPAGFEMTPDRQMALAAQLEAFSRDPAAKYLRIGKLHTSMLPDALLDIVGVDAKDTGSGAVEFRKRPEIQSPIDIQDSELSMEVPPESRTEELRRLNTIPSEIKKLEARSSQLPTEAILKQKIQNKDKELQKAIRALQVAKNPIAVEKIKQQIDLLKAEQTRFGRDLRRELASGVFSNERALIQKRIADLTLEHDIARKGYDELRRVPQPMKRDIAQARKKEGEEGKTAKTEAISRFRSRATDAEYTQGLDRDLRAYINHSLAGFGIRDEGNIKMYVGTYDELLKGHLADVKGEIQDYFKRAERKFTKSAGLSDVLKDSGFILLDDGKATPENMFYASHEVGHVLHRSVWDKAPMETKAAVFGEFQKARETAMKRKRAGDAAKDLANPLHYLADDNRPIDQLPPQDKDYLLSDDLGFEEWFSNRVADYLLNPTKKPANAAQKVIKSIADAFRRVWQGLKERFGEKAPTLDQWLDDQFNLDRSRKVFGKIKSEAEGFFDRLRSETGAINLGGKKPGPQKERRFTERIRKNTQSEKVKEGTTGQMYEPLSRKTTMKEVKARVDQQGINASMAEALDPESKLRPDVQVAYAAEIVNRLEKQYREATDPAVKEQLAQQQINFANSFAPKATEFGRAVNMFQEVYGKMSPRNFNRAIKNQIERSFGRAKIPMPDGWEAIADDVIKAHYEKLKTTDADSFLMGEVMRSFYDDLNAKLNIPSRNPWSFFWYGNILSGFKTQAANLLGNSSQMLLGNLSLAASHPKQAVALMRGMLQGALNGTDAITATYRGMDLRKGTGDKYGMSNSLVAPQVKWEGRFTKLLNKPFNTLLKGLEFYPFRTLAAVDSMFYRVNHDGYANFAASRVLENAQARKGVKLTPEEFADQMSKLLHNSDAELAVFREQAERETRAALGDRATQNDVDIRVLELMDKARDPGLQSGSKRHGERMTYTNRPEGTFGAIADAINTFTAKVSLGRYTAFPFTNVVSNVLSNSLDYTPLGIVRGALGRNIMNASDNIWSKAERKQRAAAGILGTAAASLLYAMADDDIDKADPSFAVYAAGPVDPSQRQALQSKGWVPYSIKVGDAYLKYSELPLNAVFGVIGSLHDLERYSPKFNRQEAYERAQMALQGAAGTILDMGFLRSVSDLFDVIQGDKKVDVALANPVKGMLPWSGMMRDITEFVDPDKKDYKDAKAAWLSGIPFVESFVRPAQNAFGEPIDKANRFVSLAGSDPVWKWMAENDLSISAPENSITIGTGSSKVEKSFLAGVSAQREKVLGRFAHDILTEDESYAINEAAGPRIKVEVAKAMKGKASKKDLQNYVDKIVRQERQRAKIQYLEQWARSARETPSSPQE